MKLTILTLIFILTGCRSRLDANSIEVREHGLSYIKGTNKLVDGEVVRKADGQIMELHNYKDGKMIGDFFQFGANGQLMSRGFGTEIKGYEKLIGSADLTNCVLSVVQVRDEFSYATLYMDNPNLFNDTSKLLRLSKSLFVDYLGKYKTEELLIFDTKHEYSVSRTATSNTQYAVDTVHVLNPIKLNFR